MSGLQALKQAEGVREVATKPGKFNILAANRREKRLMSLLVADPGMVFVSSDLNSGEPTVTTQFSKDPYYHAACFGMVGKPPYYEGDVLMIDDIYIMTMSVSPIGRAKVRKAFNEGFDGVGFVDLWMTDKEKIQKGYFKADRELHKILCLGLAYGLSSPKSMISHAEGKGYSLTVAEARGFKQSYWELFSGVEAFSRKLIRQWHKDGAIVNPFGYRCLPDADYKVMNSFIQSSVSGLMKLICVKFFAVCNWVEFVVIIHDEIILQVPEDRLDEAKALWDATIDSVNEDLGWDVKVRAGWSPGKDLYSAK